MGNVKDVMSPIIETWSILDDCMNSPSSQVSDSDLKYLQTIISSGRLANSIDLLIKLTKEETQ